MIRGLRHFLEIGDLEDEDDCVYWLWSYDPGRGSSATIRWEYMDEIYSLSDVLLLLDRLGPR